MRLYKYSKHALNADFNSFVTFGVQLTDTMF